MMKYMIMSIKKKIIKRVTRKTDSEIKTPQSILERVREDVKKAKSQKTFEDKLFGRKEW